MAEIGTTSIDQLPVNVNQNNSSPPVQQNNNTGLAETQNIKIENYGQQLNNERQNSMQQGGQPMNFDPDMNTILKDAASVGATNLPSRDIPLNTTQIQHDQEIKANYVPNNESNDYIGNILDREKIIKENTIKQNKSDNMDYIYQQLQLPFLVGVMYFLFQLPAVRKHVLSFLPSLFNTDGNPNLYGYIFNSVMFGLLYSFLIKGIQHISNI